MNTNKILLDEDHVDPATENWRAKDDAEVWHAAKAGVPQAVAELRRREAVSH